MKFEIGNPILYCEMLVFVTGISDNKIRISQSVDNPGNVWIRQDDIHIKQLNIE